MVERNIIVAMLLIVITFSVSGFIVGQFLTPVEQVTTTSSTTIFNTTTSVLTRTTTLTWKITETTTLTNTIVMEPPKTLPSPANSSAIIRGHLLFNGTMFVMFSIDKPIYSIGEIVHIKATMTNLTPNDISFSTGTAMIWIENETKKRVWSLPESTFVRGIGPAPQTNWVELGPEDTISLDWATVDWNMTGLQRIIIRQSGAVGGRAAYNDFLVPEGQYTLIWSPDFQFSQIEKVDDTITFAITKQD